MNALGHGENAEKWRTTKRDVNPVHAVTCHAIEAF